MRARIVFAILVTYLAAPALALAHGASHHKGKPTTGLVTSLTGDRMVLKTEKGEVPVTLSAETKVEDGRGHDATRGDLKTGEEVMVFGTKLASGELVAREVMIHDDHTTDKESRVGSSIYARDFGSEGVPLRRALSASANQIA